MNVLAVSTPRRPAWRWRIVDYGGATVEESSTGFATIALAVAEGTRRLRERVDRGLVDPPPGPGPAAWRPRRADARRHDRG